MSFYSFKNISGTIVGPGGVALLANDAAADEEGIDVETVSDKNDMQIGADGAGQHSLLATDAGRVVVRLLKTSPMNAILMAMYNLQSSSSSLWGQNVIAFVDSARGDLVTCQSCAFKKRPNISYKTKAGMNEWEFDSIKATIILGV